MFRIAERAVQEPEEKILSNKLSALTMSEPKIRSLLKKISNFEAAVSVMHASQKSIHEDLISMQDKFLSCEISKQTNALFDSLGALMTKLSHCFAQFPAKISEFQLQYDNLTKNICKKRTFLQEKYHHYLSKFQTLVNKQEEENLKLHPSAFISSVGTGQGIKSLKSSVSNHKLTRNSEKLKSSSNKYKDIHLISSAFTDNMLARRSEIIQSMCKQIAECFSELKGENLIFSQALKKNEETSNQIATQQFSTDSSLEREQLDKEIAMRSLFRIPAGMELPVIRRPNMKITSDGKVRMDSTNNNSSLIDPVPFQSDDPNLIIYLRKLIQQEKNIFDFEDFNNGEATLNINCHRKSSAVNYCQDKRQDSIERVNTRNSSKHEEDYEDDEVNLEILNKSPQQVKIMKATSEAIFQKEQEKKRTLLEEILKNEQQQSSNKLQIDTPKQRLIQTSSSNPLKCINNPLITSLSDTKKLPSPARDYQNKDNITTRNEGTFSFFINPSLPSSNRNGERTQDLNPFEEFIQTLPPAQEQTYPQSFPQMHTLNYKSSSTHSLRNTVQHKPVHIIHNFNKQPNQQHSQPNNHSHKFPSHSTGQHIRLQTNLNPNSNQIMFVSSLSNEEDTSSELSLNLLDDSDN